MKSTSSFSEVVPIAQSNEEVHRIINKEMTKNKYWFQKATMDQMTNIEKH